MYGKIEKIMQHVLCFWHVIAVIIDFPLIVPLKLVKMFAILIKLYCGCQLGGSCWSLWYKGFGHHLCV